ncbi:MAG: Glutathione S-transferase, N-terminal domain [Sphingomonas bacterium]|uniref:glutathione S-transferase n=1 Tax=Sphingomonas bacterium TaxID=1895847 RepID=UPI0026159961|nr:glutathione S-transferase [Sphingomonas bacterium]MDB5706988.1 Glutathione S-transferase, N-terminal domain [Sphingomonas bacterium]
MSGSLPILYSFRRCPYAMRARMAVLIAGETVELREVTLRDKPADMVAASPKATVPVLALPDGAVIDESIEIMRWALARQDPEGWLAGDDAAVIARNDGPFKHHLDRYKYPDRHDADPLPHRAACLAILAELEPRLARATNLCGEGRSLTDIALMPFVRQFAATDRAWFGAQPLPAVQAWLARHIGSDLFDRAMVRLAPWRPGDAPVFFGGGA